MSKESPWFKFFPGEWLIGKISIQPLDVQGAFIQCACVFWQNNGVMMRSDLDFRIGDAMIDTLIKQGFILESEQGLSIKFLDEQLELLGKMKEKRSLAGKASGLARNRKSKKDNTITKNINKKTFTPPTLQDVNTFFTENGYPVEQGTKAFHYYADGNWKDSRGKPVLNWKQKMRANWFKEENKKPVIRGYTPHITN